MAAYEIRRIEPAHAQEWLRLRSMLWEDEDHWPEIEQFFVGDLEEPNEVLLAFDANGRAVAHVELSIRTDVDGLVGIRTGYIEGLYIEPAHRATGLAWQLLHASQQRAVAAGCRAFASDRDDRVIIHERFGPAPDAEDRGGPSGA